MDKCRGDTKGVVLVLVELRVKVHRGFIAEAAVAPHSVGGGQPLLLGDADILDAAVGIMRPTGRSPELLQGHVQYIAHRPADSMERAAFSTPATYASLRQWTHR